MPPKRKKTAPRRGAPTLSKDRVRKSEKMAERTTKRREVAAGDAAVPVGEKQKAVGERKKQRTKEQARQVVEQKARHTATLRQLKPIAKEINVRFEKAAKLDGNADDHRLAAAIRLEAARKMCDQAKINFHKWVDGNVGVAYEEVKKLVRVAVAPEPAKALADMREGAAARNRKLRQRQRASRDAQPRTSMPARIAASPFETAGQVLSSLLDKQVLCLIEDQAANLGMRVVSETDAERVSSLDDGRSKKKKTSAFAGTPVAPTIDDCRKLFLELKASDKLLFVRWAGDNIGVVVTGDFQDDLSKGVPANLRRKKGDGGDGSEARV